MFELLLYLLYAVLLGVWGVGLWRLRFALTHFRPIQSTAPHTSDEPPTVSVCIPARNEDHSLTDCLQAVLASTYPKLEIIVLDDLSGDETPVLIKSFASEGVRFVEGSALPAGWLGKNHALEELRREASGTYVLFMDADTRLQPDSISKLVSYAQQEKAAMVSVLPRREDGWRGSVLFPALRYFWEVLFHRQAAPATASNAWLIHRQALNDLKGGFESFKASIQPESMISALLMRTGQYRFVMGTPELGIAYEKKWRTQLETSIRLLFPLLAHKVSHAIVAVLDLLIVVSPLGVVLAGFVTGWGVHQGIAAGFLLLYAILYGIYAKHGTAHGWWLTALLWPVVVIQEIILLILSVVRYKRGTVTWKGRRVRPVQSAGQSPAARN